MCIKHIYLMNYVTNLALQLLCLSLAHTESSRLQGLSPILGPIVNTKDISIYDVFSIRVVSSYLHAPRLFHQIPIISPCTSSGNSLPPRLRRIATNDLTSRLCKNLNTPPHPKSPRVLPTLLKPRLHHMGQRGYLSH